MKQFTVTSLNTLYGRSIINEPGTSHLYDCDLLLLQEVFYPLSEDLPNRLEELGFTLVGNDGGTGLVIAMRSESSLKLKYKSLRLAVIHSISKTGSNFIRKYPNLKFGFQSYGILSAQFITPNKSQISIATTHLPVVMSLRKRASFLTLAVEELKKPCYGKTLILAGDMNHYPKSRAKDIVFREKSKFSVVDLSGQDTWPSRGASRLGGRFARYYGGQLDDILYRGSIKPVKSELFDAKSDHKAIKVIFEID